MNYIWKLNVLAFSIKHLEEAFMGILQLIPRSQPWPSQSNLILYYYLAFCKVIIIAVWKQRTFFSKLCFMESSELWVVNRMWWGKILEMRGKTKVNSFLFTKLLWVFTMHYEQDWFIHWAKQAQCLGPMILLGIHRNHLL